MGAIMQNNHVKTSEEIAAILDAALGPNSPDPTPDEIALHRRRRERGESMQSYLASEQLKAKQEALQAKLKVKLAPCIQAHGEQSGDQP